ncbi:retrovirus-related pol polyprotein from transposon TNT 1-94 [Tanacetum coccineum]|uniref:Retrovirus-related pol polyprotein from transposon TNT 1-94 n=1 Tax=Tanacetum coccineum TaxID=301880 RepID=A0ABQ4XX99_9ASTR
MAKVHRAQNVYRNKKDERGIVIKNKESLVAQGYTQEEGMDYDEVFAPIARIEAIRLFLAYAFFKDFMVYQMDVNSAFLYGKIKEEVYVCQPPGFEDPYFPNRVYKVEKALYGWHQAPRACDYAGASLDRKSTTGGCQFLGCRLISWQCKKQIMVANSTTEAEYVAASMKNSVFYSKTKHIEIRHHLIRDSNEMKLIQMIKIHTDKNVVDLLTKAFDFAESHNIVAFLAKPTESEGFEQIVDFLNVNPIKYALMVNPTIYTSCIEQFWATAKTSVRRDLQLEDAEGIECLPNADIFEQLALMSAKSTAWNEFSSTMASAIICLATDQKFNFSKYIFESMVKNVDSSVKFLMYPRTDHDREFDNEVQFREFCDANGITHNFSAPRTPQSNGVVERKKRTLQEISRTMLNEQLLPQKFWCNVVDTSTYILNRILIRAILGKTPNELLRGRKPTLDYFKVFGSKYFIINIKDYLTKFDPKSYKESLNVTFDETPPPSKTSPLVDDDLDEVEAVKITEKKNLENSIEDEILEIDEIVNVKESRNHPLENVIGNLNQRTLRLVAQGYNQQDGIDYDETYALVARLESIRILLAYLCALDFKLFQMDVKSAFLNGLINDEVYMAQPSGFVDFEKPDHVYKLKKALYGLKQEPKAESPELLNDSYVLYDRVMDPLTAQQERKTRKDRGTRRGHRSTSSSSAFDQPSSSHLNDDDDGNEEGTSCASTPSPTRFVNSLTNEVP